MKIGEILRRAGVVVVIAIVVLVIVFHLFGAKAIKIGIEIGATKALKVPVTVEKVNLSPLAGKAGLKGLVVDNPPGYQNEKMLEVGLAQVDLQMSSVLSDPVTIEDVRLDKVVMVLEQKGLTNNIQEVLEGISARPSEPKPAAEKPAKKLFVKKLLISQVAVKVKLLPVPGKQDTMTLRLASITMTDLGSDDKMDMAVLTSKILVEIANGIAEEGAGVLPAEIIGPMGDTVKNIGAAVQATITEAGKAVKEGEKAAGKFLEDTQKASEEIKKGLGELLKGKEKDEE